MIFMRCRLFQIGLCLCWFAFAGQALADLKVEGKPRWGFDGTVRSGEFNLLRVRIFNDSDKPWQGSVWIQPQLGIQRVDVPALQPDLFIEPYGERNLQFYAFVPDPTEYTVAWGQYVRGRFFEEDHLEIDAPTARREELAIELTRDETSSRGSSLPTFDVDQFPSSAVVLVGLDTLVLNHVPSWQDQQVRAFRDWLFQGGTLYLKPDSTGEALQFGPSLAELNEPSDQFPVGYGRVIRTSSVPDLASAKTDSNQYYNSLNASSTLFSLLKAITTPEHNWPLIYGLAVIYLLILFPGCWLLGRRKGDFRITYVVILATVGMFSFGFHTIGKRGYGEETSINSVAVVRPAQPGRWLVKQWSNLFVTSGKTYLIEHHLTSGAASTGQHMESVLGVVANQPNAVMQTDIPSFSNRTLLHTGILQGDGPRPQLGTFSLSGPGGTIQSLVLNFPQGENLPKMRDMVAVYRNQIYQLRRSEHQLSLAGGSQLISNYLDSDSLRYNKYRFGREESNTPEAYFQQTWHPLIAADLGLIHEEAIRDFSLPEDVLKIYIMTDMDAPFFFKGEISPQQNGRVLYVYDLHVDPEIAI